MPRLGQKGNRTVVQLLSVTHSPPAPQWFDIQRHSAHLAPRLIGHRRCCLCSWPAPPAGHWLPSAQPKPPPHQDRPQTLPQAAAQSAQQRHWPKTAPKRTCRPAPGGQPPRTPRRRSVGCAGYAPEPGPRHGDQLPSRQSVQAAPALPARPAVSRATKTGICSAHRPGLLALPPRLRAALGSPRRVPLKDSRTNVSSASTIPDRRVGLSRLRASRNRCLHRNAVV